MNNRLRDIPKSRALTTGFKLFAAVAAFAMAGALLNGIQTCKPDVVGWEYPPVVCTGDQGLLDSFLGPITVGWKGGIGDHFVYSVLFTLAAVGIFLAGFLTAFRDADPRSVAEAAGTDTPPPVNPPSHISFWPALTAFSVAFMAIGLVANPATFVAGAVALGVCIVMWTLRNWAEHATGDAAVNEQINQRIAFGLEVPLIAVMMLGAVAISISRVLLSVGHTEAVIVAGVVAAVFFLAGVAVAYLPRIGRSTIVVFAITAGLLVIGAGIAASVAGERDFEHHGDESGETHGEGTPSEGGDAPVTTEVGSN